MAISKARRSAEATVAPPDGPVPLQPDSVTVCISARDGGHADAYWPCRI